MPCACFLFATKRALRTRVSPRHSSTHRKLTSSASPIRFQRCRYKRVQRTLTFRIVCALVKRHKRWSSTRVYNLLSGTANLLTRPEMSLRWATWGMSTMHSSTSCTTQTLQQPSRAAQLAKTHPCSPVISSNHRAFPKCLMCQCEAHGLAGSTRCQPQCSLTTIKACPQHCKHGDKSQALAILHRALAHP